MRLEVYCEAAPLEDHYFGQGLLRALVPILTALDAETVRLFCFPTHRRIYRNMVIAEFRDRTQISHPIFAKAINRLDHTTRCLSAFLFASYCRMFLRAEHEATHVFAVIGANYHALLRAQIFARIRQLPLVIYLVDDLVEPVRIKGKHVDPDTLQRVRQALREAHAVFCISDALAMRISETANVSPISINLPYIEHTDPIVAAEKPQLIFIGSVNFLYASALRRVIDAVTLLNTRQPDAPVCVLITSHRETALDALGRVPDFVRFESFDSRAALLSEIAASRAAILPYSFEPEHRPMVESSFPSKMLDYLEAARDILLVAPAYSSAARYYEGIAGMEPLASVEDIQARIVARPDPELRQLLRGLLRERHSIDNYRGVIALAVAGGLPA